MQKLSEVEVRRHLDIGRSLATEAGRSIERTIAAGVEAYDRERHLPRLIPLGQEELARLIHDGPSEGLADVV
jgi:hypothetical protein